MQVRWEGAAVDTAAAASARGGDGLPWAFAEATMRELPEAGGLAEMGAACREAGIEELFRVLIKL